MNCWPILLAFHDMRMSPSPALPSIERATTGKYCGGTNLTHPKETTRGTKSIELNISVFLHFEPNSKHVF